MLAYIPAPWILWVGIFYPQIYGDLDLPSTMDCGLIMEETSTNTYWQQLAYPPVIKHSNGKSPINGGFQVKKTSINWPFSIATFYRKVMALSIPLSVRPWALNRSKLFNHTQRIHGAAIYANINGADIDGIHGAPYIADYSSTVRIRHGEIPSPEGNHTWQRKKT